MSEKKGGRLATIAEYLALGAFVMAGMRAVEWLVPEPEQHILVCMASDLEKRLICRDLDELVKAKEKPAERQEG